MKKSLSILAVFFAASLSPVFAQTTVLTLRIQQGQNVFPAVNGQTLSFASNGVGLASALTLTGTNAGPTPIIFSAQPQILGGPEFTSTPIGNLPLTVAPGASFKVDITYTPTNTSPAVAQLIIPFVQSSITPGQPGTGGTVTLNLNGVVPNFSVNYLIPPNNNVTPLSNGGTLTFPSTLTKTTVTATVLIANLGTGPSTVNSIALSGAAFQLQSVGLLPAGLQSGSNLSFVIKYSPVTPGLDTGVLTIGFANQIFTVNVEGTGITPILSYQGIDGDAVLPLTVGQQITVPDTPVGVLRSIAIQVQNTGTAATNVNAVSSSGAGFTLTDLPFFPAPLAPGESFTFTLNYTPTQAGPAAGTLTVGTDRFRISGNGIGAQLTYNYSAGTSGTAVTVQPPTGTVLFPSVPLAQTSSTVFTVTNVGTSATTLTSVFITGTSAASYSLRNLAALPLTLAPGASVRFTINFSPTTPGVNPGTLLVNGQTFALSGFGTSVPSLPSFQITGLSGQVPPFTQPNVGLQLSQAYPLDLTGSLVMTVVSDVFSADPSVQFASGGRTVTFTIPAGSTQAVFSNNSRQIQLQSGTVAETIDIAATFATSGGVNVTPANTPALALAVPRNVPTLISVDLQSFTTTGFSIVVTGFSTTRSLSKVNVQFAGAPGLTLSGASFTVDVSRSAGFWFSSSTSTQFGGLFAITIPVSAQVVNGSALTTLLNQFTVTATATNEIGTSSGVTSVNLTATGTGH